MTWVFDGHLDLAMNALEYERDQTMSVSALREREAGSGGGGVADDRGVCTVSLDEMRKGGVRVCVATLIARAKPWVCAGRKLKRGGDWPSQDMAHAVAMGQWAYYQLLAERGCITLIGTRGELERHLADWEADPDQAGVGVILAMEGADPITRPEELDFWHARGLRTLMLAHFGRSHYAHGTPSTDPSNQHDVDGPLPERTKRLLDRMGALGMPLDLSHLSDRSFAEATESAFIGSIYASHSSCRALVPGGEGVHPMRMLTDEQVRRIADRGGVIGIPLYNAFLRPGYTPDSPSGAVAFSEVADHIDHICQLVGVANHVAIGSDADGGFGAEHMPREIDTIADLGGLSETLAVRGYSDDDIAGILHGHWLRFYSDCLPDT